MKIPDARRLSYCRTTSRKAVQTWECSSSVTFDKPDIRRQRAQLFSCGADIVRVFGIVALAQHFKGHSVNNPEIPDNSHLSPQT
jgi:hypothetical protein